MTSQSKLAVGAPQSISAAMSVNLMSHGGIVASGAIMATVVGIEAKAMAKANS